MSELTLGIIGTAVERTVLAITLHQSTTAPRAFALLDGTLIVMLVIIHIIKMQVFCYVPNKLSVIDELNDLFYLLCRYVLDYIVFNDRSNIQYVCHMSLI